MRVVGGMCVCVCVYQEQQSVVDDEVSGQADQVSMVILEQRWDQNQSQILSRHLVLRAEHLDPGGNITSASQRAIQNIWILEET